MKLLVVDDSELMRSIVEDVLRDKLTHSISDLEFFHAANGEDALKIMREYDINLVFLDWNMPILDGIEFVKDVRSKGNRVPIVMITSITDSDRILQAAAAGVNSYLEKPIKGQELWDQIRMFFQ